MPVQRIWLTSIGSAEELAESVGCFTYQQRDASFSGIELETSWSLSDTQRVELQGDLCAGVLTGCRQRYSPLATGNSSR